MAISLRYKSLGLLDEFRDYNLINPWYFAQVDGASVPEYACNGYTQLARELYTRELLTALDRVKRALNYSPIPVFETDTMSIPADYSFAGLNDTCFSTRFGHLIGFGSRATSELQKNVTVTYSKTFASFPDNDRATIEVTHASIATLNPDQIRVFFQVSDGAPADADERYEIHDLEISVSGSTATITGHRALFVKPEVWAQSYTLPGSEEETVNYADSSTAGDFVTAVDVFRVYPDASSAVTLTDAGGNTTTLTPAIINAEDGLFTLQYDATTNLIFSPVSVTVNYYAGEPKVNGEFDPELMKAVCGLANCHILTSTYGRCLAENILWMTDNSYFDDEAEDVTPFGRKHGQKEAWRIVEIKKNYIGGFTS